MRQFDLTNIHMQSFLISYSPVHTFMLSVEKKFVDALNEGKRSSKICLFVCLIFRST